MLWWITKIIFVVFFIASTYNFKGYVKMVRCTKDDIFIYTTFWRDLIPSSVYVPYSDANLIKLFSDVDQWIKHEQGLIYYFTNSGLLASLLLIWSIWMMVCSFSTVHFLIFPYSFISASIGYTCIFFNIENMKSKKKFVKNRFQ